MEIQLPDETQQGSLERGLSGRYALNLGDWLSEAWGRVSGNKGTIWLAMLLYVGLAFLIGLFFGLLGGTPQDVEQPGDLSLVSIIGDLVSAIVLMPMAVGFALFATAIALGYRPNPKSLFGWYDHTLKIVLTGVLMNLLILLGLLLFVLPGIYLAVSYQIALPLLVDKQLGPWQALETSRKIIWHNWFTVFVFDVLAVLLVVLSTALLGIPLIWVVPLLVIAFGILYRTLAGIEVATLQRVLAEDR
jgi:hypothetical protein